MILVVLAVVGLALLGIFALGNWFAGPDPDLGSPWDPRDSWFGRQRCVCGKWRDEAKHVHAGWQDRAPR